MRTRGSWLAFAGVVFLASPTEAGEARSRVILDGKAVPVVFNDGDSFRVLGGGREGAKARLVGYNTLESYGPAHKWGDWSTREMFVLAKMATKFAQKGEWTCESDGKTDTYGRTLVWCPELAEELVSRGLAHVMTVSDDPGKPELLAAQRDAQANHRGMWAHGIPAFILTSLHSREEDVDGKGTYNRLVSTDDAHSVKWRHDTHYDECEEVCHRVYAPTSAQVDELVTTLKAAREGGEAPVAEATAGLDDTALQGLADEFARFRHVNRSVLADARPALKTWMLEHLGSAAETPASSGACMIHVDFKRRFGEDRAACLK